MSWGEFFHMGGYAVYVWSSYGMALLVLVYNIVAPILRKRRLLRDLVREKSRKSA